MESELRIKTRRRASRKLRVRKKLSGTSARPRMSVFKSNCYIHVQLIDDESCKTLASCSSSQKFIRDEFSSHKNQSVAKFIGEKIAKIALELGIKQVVFDRGSSCFHGCLKVIADTARENGLEF